MTSLKVKMKTFEKLLPTAEVVIYDNESKSLEVNGKPVVLTGIDIEEEFLKTKKELEAIKATDSTTV